MGILYSSGKEDTIHSFDLVWELYTATGQSEAKDYICQNLATFMHFNGEKGNDSTQNRASELEIQVGIILLFHPRSWCNDGSNRNKLPSK